MTKSNPHWEEEVVHRIDSTLNKWRSSIPNHLQWPASSPGTIFYYQSAALQLNYYHVQIQVHRPYIPSLIGRTTFSLASLAICANAARACSHIFSILTANPPVIIPPFTAPITLSASLFLLIHLWEAEKFGLRANIEQEFQNLRHCIHYLGTLSKRAFIALQFSKLLDHILQEESSRLNLRHKEPGLSSGPSSHPANNPNSLPVDLSTSAECTDSWTFNDIALLQNLSDQDPFYQDRFAFLSDSMSSEAVFHSLWSTGRTEPDASGTSEMASDLSYRTC